MAKGGKRKVLRAAFLGLLPLCALVVSCSTTGPGQQGLRAVLWVQTSAEYRACAEQAYRAAKASLDLALKRPEWTAALGQKKDYRHLPPAVILDIDRTVLDNSPFQGQLLREGRPFDRALWERWVLQEKARAVPGALEFVRYARRRGVEIFYVTNRAAHLEAATRRNLERLGFPVKTWPDTVLMRKERGWGSDKTSRRRHISERYRILLLIGDDFNDFVSGVRGRGVTVEDRRRLTDRYGSRWGKEWIVLPNPIYGSWEGALYGFEYGLPAWERRKRAYEHLKTME